MPTLKKSLGILGTQRLLTILISFVSSIIIARLLTPKEIGIYSVCVSVVGIAHVIREFGVGNYLIQEHELTRDRIRASLTILLVFAWVIAAILFIFKSRIALFYHDPRLEDVIVVLALNFLFIPISSPVLSVLRRNLEFGKVAIINITASIAQNTAAVILAMLSFGPISLAWGSFAGIIVTILLSILFRPKEVPWTPGLKDIRRVASFGSKSSLGTVVNQAGYSAPDLIIGRILSLTDVGIYSRANGFASIIIDQIGMLLHSILFPTFSHESRSGIDVIRNFKNRTEMFTGILSPALCFFGFAAQPLIILLYGDTWLPAAPIASIICFAALISVPYTLAGSFLLAHGKVGFTAKMSMIVQLLNILSVFTGAFFGLIFIPIFGIMVHLGRFFASRYALKKFFGITTRDVLKVNVKSFAVSGMTILPLALIHLFLPPSEDVHILIPLYMATASIFWISGIYLTGHALAHEFNVVLKSLVEKIGALRA